jgi:uncharacterized protein
MVSVVEIEQLSVDPPVRGFLHEPSSSNGQGLALTHGAGGNCSSKLLVGVAETFAAEGFQVLRFNLPFRQARAYGPPSPHSAERDRAGVRNAVGFMRQRLPGQIFLGGHSYGGRQASMLAVTHPDLVSALLLFSYPLHPPRRPEQMRTAHFSDLFTPALFVHGSRDPFASVEEISSAVSLIPAPHQVLEIEGGGHELLKGKTGDELARNIMSTFRHFVSCA